MAIRSVPAKRTLPAGSPRLADLAGRRGGTLLYQLPKGTKAHGVIIDISDTLADSLARIGALDEQRTDPCT